MNDERRDVFDTCREHLAYSEKPARFLTTNGKVRALYTYFDDQKGQERLLFCGFQKDGHLAQGQILGIRDRGREQFYLVRWDARLVSDENPVIERDQDGPRASHKLRLKMNEELKREVSWADLEGGYIPLKESDIKRIIAGWGY